MSPDVIEFDAHNAEIAAGDDVEMLDRTDTPTDTDVAQPDASDGDRDAGVLRRIFPSSIEGTKLLDRPGDPLPYTQLGTGSKIVAGQSFLVATAAVPNAGSMQARVLTRPIGGSLWSQQIAFNNVSTSAALALDQSDRLHLALTCQGACGPGVTAMAPSPRAILVKYDARPGDNYLFSSPSGLTASAAISLGWNTLTFDAPHTDMYWTHLVDLGMSMGYLRSYYHSNPAGYLNAVDNRLAHEWPLIDISASQGGRTVHAISNVIEGNPDPSSFRRVQVLTRIFGGPPRQDEFRAPAPNNALTTVPIAALSVELSPNGTTYLLLHGQFDATNSGRLYRRSMNGAWDFVSLGRIGTETQLHLIDDSRIVLVEAIGLTQGLRLGYSENGGDTWRWQNVAVTIGGAPTTANIFAGPSIVRPSTSPMGFNPMLIRLVFSSGLNLGANPQYTSFVYAELPIS